MIAVLGSSWVEVIRVMLCEVRDSMSGGVWELLVSIRSFLFFSNLGVGVISPVFN